MIFSRTAGSVLCALLLANLSLAENCALYTSCNQCTNNRDTAGCTWCISSGSCVRTEGFDAGSCPVFENPGSEITMTSTSEGRAFEPLRTSVKLRYLDPLVVPYVVTLPSSIPIDFYYVTDSSASFRDDIEIVKGQTTEIANLLQDLCSGGDATAADCSFGKWGSFIEKPFTKQYNSTPTSQTNKFPWSFKPLKPYFAPEFRPIDDEWRQAPSDDTDLRITGNVDNPETAYEALMQAVLCSTWNPDHRHLVLLATDDQSQVQGRYARGFLASSDGKTENLDGEKIGSWGPSSTKALLYSGKFGIDDVHRFNEKCYYDVNDPSTHSPEYIQQSAANVDAPTAAQMKKILLANNVVPIFSINQKQSFSRATESFQHLTEFFGFGEVTALSDDSDNILSIIREAYESIATTVSLTTKEDENNYFLYVQSIVDNNFPADVGVANNIRVTLEAAAGTPDLLDVAANLVIAAQGINEVQIEVSKQTCECEENPENVLNGGGDTVGTITCGITTCVPGLAGANCQCTEDTVSTPCPAPDGITCSNRGECECGECKCDPNFEGDACECAVVNVCPIGAGGLECSGPKQGSCVCGQCDCIDGFNSTDTCACPDAAVTCASDPCAVGSNCTDSGLCGYSCICENDRIGTNCKCFRCADGCIENGGDCNCGGECTCPDGYSNATTPPCICLTEDYNPTCDPTITCSGHGSCDECGQCVCQEGFERDDCSCDSGACAQNCNADLNVNNTCVCGECNCATNATDPLYVGEFCQCPNNECPISPSNGLVCGGPSRGTCDTEVDCGICQCFEGYGGDACECILQQCPVGSNGQECSGNAAMGCDECGVCQCDEGFVGTDCSCEVAANPCPNDCSGNGICIHDDSRCGVCSCTDISYTGDDCSCLTTGCPVFDNQVCGENGLGCEECTDTCICKEGFVVPKKVNSDISFGCICEEECPTFNGVECNGKGACNEDQCGCTCEAPYEGTSCSICNSDTLKNFTKCEGDLCNTERIPNDGQGCRDCLEPECPAFRCANQTCEDCQNLDPELGCAWCGSSATCVDNITALRTCEESRINEVCNPSSNIVPIIAGAIGGVVLLLVIAALIAKLIFVMLDRREWAAFEKAKAAQNIKQSRSPLYQSDQITGVNTLVQ